MKYLLPIFCCIILLSCKKKQINDLYQPFVGKYELTLVVTVYWDYGVGQTWSYTDSNFVASNTETFELSEDLRLTRFVMGDEVFSGDINNIKVSEDKVFAYSDLGEEYGYIQLYKMNDTLYRTPVYSTAYQSSKTSYYRKIE